MTWLAWLGLPIVVGVVANAWMYVLARNALKRTDEPWQKYFPFRRSQLAWLRAYRTLAHARGLPTWPIYVHWMAWTATLALILWLVSRG
jgi:hypothetical protein